MLEFHYLMDVMFLGIQNVLEVLTKGTVCESTALNHDGTLCSSVLHILVHTHVTLSISTSQVPLHLITISHSLCLLLTSYTIIYYNVNTGQRKIVDPCSNTYYDTCIL